MKAHAPGAHENSATVSTPPVPLLARGEAVDWWFAFKFNGVVFPGGGRGTERPPIGIFGGARNDYIRHGKPAWGLQYVYASSRKKRLVKGRGCLWNTLEDPVGATFDQIYNGSYNFVVWNDQFYNDPLLPQFMRQDVSGGTLNKGYMDAPWGHSKGILAWNDAGEGMIMQVTTPDWPGSGTSRHPRGRGNTLGCCGDDNIGFSQHFFALRLSPEDLMHVLAAMSRANVCTDTSNPQVVQNGGPALVRHLVDMLGRLSPSGEVFHMPLSSGVEVMAKPAKLAVPPWCLVSAKLGGVDLRVASWWGQDPIPSTRRGETIGCWPKHHMEAPGAVEIAETGHWKGKEFSLIAEKPEAAVEAEDPELDHEKNHAKIGVSLDPDHPYTIFGDMNQAGTLDPAHPGGCRVSQNARGGMFFVLRYPELWESVKDLLSGASEPDTPPAKKAPARKAAGKRPVRKTAGKRGSGRKKS